MCFEQVRRNDLPERIEHELHAFPPREFRRRHEIRIAGNENDHVRMAFQRDGGDVETDSHADALLPQGRSKIAIGEVTDPDEAAQKPLLGSCLQNPGSVSVLANFPQPHGQVGIAT